MHDLVQYEHKFIERSLPNFLIKWSLAKCRTPLMLYERSSIKENNIEALRTYIRLHSPQFFKHEHYTQH